MTRRLFLLRHAKSAWDDPELADFQRPLAPQGERAAREMGQFMAQTRVRPALILCSGAARAQQTLAVVEAGLGNGEVVVDDELYLLSAEGLLERLRRVDNDTPSVMVIGHNPGMHDLALVLAGDAANAGAKTLARRLLKGFPTCALATLDCMAGCDTDLGRGAGTGWATLAAGCCALRGFVRPKDL